MVSLMIFSLPEESSPWTWGCLGVPKVRHLNNPARQCGVWNAQSNLIAACTMHALMICCACREREE